MERLEEECRGLAERAERLQEENEELNQKANQ